MNDKTEDLPWYVKEYISKKRRILSPATLLNYCHDYIIFFEWLNLEKIYIGKFADVSLALLETLTTQQIEDFLAHLEMKLNNSKLTANRKLSALKSLFDYLQNQAETKDLKPYLERNVMAKVQLNSIKEDQETKANRIEGKILRGDEFDEFRQFVAYDYGEVHKNDKKLYNFHQKNRERDTALISLILGSGLRLHTLRHSFATRYHQENNDVPKLRNQLGHSAIQTTMIYTHLTNDELKQAFFTLLETEVQLFDFIFRSYIYDDDGWRNRAFRRCQYSAPYRGDIKPPVERVVL